MEKWPPTWPPWTASAQPHPEHACGGAPRCCDGALPHPDSSAHKSASIASPPLRLVCAAPAGLTRELRDACLPVAQREYAELQAFAAAQAHEGALEPWDLTFYAERQREQLYEYTEEELRPYFSLPNVLDGLFQLTERLFGVRVEAASSGPGAGAGSDVAMWHPDCQFFHIYAAGGSEKLASFYLDPYR